MEAGESETIRLFPVEIKGDALPLRTSYCDSVFAFLLLRFCVCILLLHFFFCDSVSMDSFGNKLHISVLFPDNFSVPNYMISL